MMIYILRGGLGNQLFIFGASLIDKSSCLEDKAGFKIDTRYKRELEIEKLYSTLVYKKCKFSIPPLFLRILVRFFDNKVVYPFNLGYFQRSSNLRPLKEVSTFRKFNRLVIHMRLSDYSLSYTNDIQEYIKAILDRYEIEKYVVTDEYSIFERTFPLLSQDLIHFSSNSIEDWLFIAESQVAIISDSSFSFTSAFLGCNKEIYHPNMTNIEIDDKGEHIWKSLSIPKH